MLSFFNFQNNPFILDFSVEFANQRINRFPRLRNYFSRHLKTPPSSKVTNATNVAKVSNVFDLLDSFDTFEPFETSLTTYSIQFSPLPKDACAGEAHAGIFLR